MNLQEYISSGIIESYVMGMASDKEAAEFEQLCEQHPELQEARHRFELTLEERAHLNAVSPPQGLKEKIWQAIQNDMASRGKVVALPANTSSAKTRRLIPVKWAVAASIVLLLATGYFIYDSERIKDKLARAKEQREELERLAEARQQAGLPDHVQPKQVKVNQPASVPASIKVFWDSTNTSVYLVISDLEKLPEDQQYQLWSVKNGKYTSRALFNAPEDTKNPLIVKVDSVQDADSFAISIEKTGNKNDEPTPLKN
ncbi:MAG TPA: anti-sigma factor [Chitinophagaceae bacterium]|nr:anti-sigma factor [Chitinophagaceae bacterium]